MCKMTKLGRRRTEGRAARRAAGDLTVVHDEHGNVTITHPRSVGSIFDQESFTDDELLDASLEDLQALFDQGAIDDATYQWALDAKLEDEKSIFDDVSAGDVIGVIEKGANAFASLFNAFKSKPEPVPRDLRPRIEPGDRPARPVIVAQPAGGGAGELVTKVFSSPLTYLGAAGTVAMQVLAPQQQTIVKALPILAGVGAVAYDTFAAKPRRFAQQSPRATIM